MTTLVFLLAVGTIIAIVLAIETGDADATSIRRPIGLFAWLTHGNWPTKIGGALIVVGVGALLRYAALNLEVPPPFKIAAGILAAAALGLASASLPAVAARRPVSLALAGSAFGVAYMTAYSAFALFGYLNNPEGLALLGVTSLAVGAYAVARGAISLAVLSMLGAYLAPAFAVADPGAAVVYGYYVGASVLTLVLVSLRGWHPLIHLSFLFTLVGGVFFAWTAKYYVGADAGVMLPMTLVLSAVHVAMPIVEHSVPRSAWTSRADIFYTIALPAVAAMLAVLLAANRQDLATALIALGVIWAFAALAYRVSRKEGMAAHAAIAALLVILGVATQFRDLPWELMALAFSAGSLAVAAKARQPADRLHNLLAGLVLVFGAIQILTSSASRSVGPPFLNAVFCERVIAATLLVLAGIVCRRIRQSLDMLLLVAGGAWGLIALGVEALRYDLAPLALLVHWAAVLLCASLWLPGRKYRGLDRHAGWLAAIVVCTTVWAAASGLTVAVVWFCIVTAPLALIGIAIRPVTTEGDSTDQRLVAALLAPAAALIWAGKAGALAGIEARQFGPCVAALAALVTLSAGALAKGKQAEWVNVASDVAAVAFAAVVTFATLFDIARNPWAVTLELECLAGLGLVAWIRANRGSPDGMLAVTLALGVALVAQANLLRFLGPPGDLDVGDILKLRLPAVVSLSWAVVGSLLTIWSRKASSRALWLAGAGLLVGAAVKLLVVDFGSLGQLANILAVIAAGAVFLLVGWLVPIPPSHGKRHPVRPLQKHPEIDDPETAIPSYGRPDESRKTAWTVAVLLSVSGLLLSSEGKLLDPWRAWYGRASHRVVRYQSGHERVGTPSPVSPIRGREAGSANARPVQTTDDSVSAVDVPTTASSQGTERGAVAAPVAKAELLKEYPQVTSTWGERLNPSGKSPLGRFSAYYLRSGEPSQLVATDTVNDVSINYAWAEFHGIKSEDFEGYWVGRFLYDVETPVYLTVDQSWSVTRVIVDRRLVYEGGSNARVPYVFSPGTHTVEVEFANNWHTTSLAVNFVEAQEPLASGELGARLREIVPADALVQFAAAYESGSPDNVVVLNLAPSRGPVILALSSYSSVKWRIRNPDRVDLRAIVYGGYAPGSRIETDAQDDAVPRLLAKDRLGSYDASPHCACVGGIFHCEGGSLLETVQIASAALGYRVVGFTGEYSPKEMDVPGVVVTPAVMADARAALERIGNARRACDKTRELH